MDADNALRLLTRAINDKAIPNGKVWLCYRPGRGLSRKERKNMLGTGFILGGLECWLSPPDVIGSQLWKRFLKKSDPYGFKKPKQRKIHRSSGGMQGVPILEAMSRLSSLHIAQKSGMIPKGDVWVFFKPNRNLEDGEKRQIQTMDLKSGEYGHWVFPGVARALLVLPKLDLMDRAIVTAFEQGKRR